MGERMKIIISLLKPWRPTSRTDDWCNKVKRCLHESHMSFYHWQTPSICLLNHTWIPLAWHLPPGWGSPHRVRRWLEVKARTIRRTSPAGCAVSWRMRRWRSRSSAPESTRCHSTSSHPPTDSTAPYLGRLMERREGSFINYKQKRVEQSCSDLY